MTNFLKSHGQSLFEKGFDIVPIKEGTKRPSFKNWQKTQATEASIKTWLKNPKNTGVGILTKHNPAIDIDVRDADMVAKLEDYLFDYLLAEQMIEPTEMFKRVGRPPKCLFLFHTDEPFKKLSSRKYVDILGDEHQIEVLGDGQQFVAFHVHPDTGKPYEWQGSSPDQINNLADLPYLNREQAIEFIDYFESIVPDDWELKNEGDTKSGEKAADMRLDEAERVLQNYQPPLGISDKKANRMLAVVDPNDFDYDSWLKVGMACYHQFEGTEDGFDKWVSWSERSEKHDETDMRTKWESFDTDLTRTNPVTFAYVVKLANEATKETRKEKNKERAQNFKLIHARDILAKLGPIDWQVKGYIETDTTGILFGDPGSYKSFIALDLALHCAAGVPWHKHDVRQGPVIYVAGEGHGGFARRLKAWELHNEQSVEELPVYFSQQAASLYDEESADIVTKAIDGVVDEIDQPPVMIVIDTLARNFGPGDENSTADMNTFVDNVDKMLRAKYGCTVLIVHHTGHANKERARGAMALKGALDYEYRLEKQFDSKVRLTCTKMKDAVEPPETWFEGHSIVVGMQDDGDEMASLAFDMCEAPVEAELSLKGKQLEAFNYLRNAVEAGEGLAKKELQKALVDVEISTSNDTARKLINTLIEKENFYENQGFIYVSDDF